jgi:hypothetical protein
VSEFRGKNFRALRRIYARRNKLRGTGVVPRRDEVELLVHAKTAKVLRLEIPPTLLQRADDVMK